MRHAISNSVLATFTLAAILCNAQVGSAADKTAQPARPSTLPATNPYSAYGHYAAPATPAPQKPDATMEKVKALGDHLGRAWEIAVDLLAGNQTDLLSKNNTNLLSGNAPKVFSGKEPKVLNGNKTAVMSGNTVSGNTVSLFSNIHLFSDVTVVVHVENRGKNNGNCNLKTGEQGKQAETGVSVPSAGPSVMATPTTTPTTSSPYNTAPNPYAGTAPGPGYAAPAAPAYTPPPSGYSSPSTTPAPTPTR